MKIAVVAGAGGFIGNHLVRYLKKNGYKVIGVDLKEPEFSPTQADDFVVADLRDSSVAINLITSEVDEVYQLAADMGGAGYLFTGESDADIMHNSALINLNILKACANAQVKKVFYSSSACVYPEYNQMDPSNPKCNEDSVYPAQPDSEYGWEKLFSERLYFSFRRNYGLDIKVARFHNIFGPEGTFEGGKEKAPAALARKVVMAVNQDSLDIWGDGNQTRSFLYIDDCIEAVYQLMQSDFSGPVNIGSDELISINNLAKMYIAISGKSLNINHIDGPIGVQGRNSDNKLISEKLGWTPRITLKEGLSSTYHWIEKQIEAK